ncbi:hypothetical protein PG994_000891 [Apiospora phragmitis]|uniref:RNase H type-1 domain-containing protein n=1 Tax=Apiospora phragmitis TaxID=2905665 RepID=A0ABR1WR13_9PEZI
MIFPQDYDGFLASQQRWPVGAQIKEQPPQTLTTQQAQPSPSGGGRCSPRALDCGAQTDDCRSTITGPQVPEATNKTSESEKPALVFGSIPRQHQFDFISLVDHGTATQLPVPSPGVPLTTPLILQSSKPTNKPLAKAARLGSQPVAQTTPPPYKQIYENIEVFRRSGERSRYLANHATRLADLGDRIVMFTDGSARSAGYGSPRTSAVTCRHVHDTKGVPKKPWINRSFGVWGIETSQEAKIVAVAEAVNALEQEVRSYVEARKQQANSRFRVLIFSDSKNCLSILDRMTQTLMEERPFTGRDWTVERLKASVKRLVETIASTNLELPIEFHWIKSHSGIEGNNRADRLASEAFPITKSYFSGHNPPACPATHEVEAKSNNAPLADEPLSATESANETDESWKTIIWDIEPIIDNAKPNAEPQANDTAPLSDVYRTIADLRRELREQREEERQKSEKMTSKFLQAMVELKRPSLNEDGMAQSKQKPDKQRRRNALVATIRQAGKRLRSIGRKSRSS